MRAEREHRGGDARAAGRDERAAPDRCRRRRIRPSARRRVFHVPSALNRRAVGQVLRSRNVPGGGAGARVGLVAREARGRAGVEHLFGAARRRSPSSGRACGRVRDRGAQRKCAGRRVLGAARDRAAFGPPFGEPAVEDRDVARAERAQHPPGARRGVIVRDCRTARCGRRRRPPATPSARRTARRGGSIDGRSLVVSASVSRSRNTAPGICAASYSARASPPGPPGTDPK